MGSESSARATCIFCGANDQKMSNEHVWPEWLGKHLPPGAGKQPHSYSFVDSERGEYRRLEGLKPHAMTIRDVCEPCNTTWMHRAEDDAGFIMRRLMNGATELGVLDQAKLAFWGILKALVAVRSGDAQARQASFLQTEDYRELYACNLSRMPPDDYLVNVARAGWSAKEAPAGFMRLSGIGRMEDRHNGDKFDGYAITYSALDLVVLVIRIPGVKPTGLIPFDDPRFARTIRRIWPVQPGGVTWPPDDALTWAGMEALSGGSIGTP